MAYILNITLL